MEPLFLQPVFQERIWGGRALQDVFEYSIPSEQTGECWAISAHPNGETTVQNGRWKGWTLSQLWSKHRSLFGGVPGDRFPLLTKILDANADLSVQVHPNDNYAAEHENGEYGKTECWYIIDCEENAEIVFGHHAETKQDMQTMIKKGEWSSFLRRFKIKPGDFFYVPSGTVHALCKGTLVLETQQNSDTTYRLYDYDRVDDQGKRRALHLEKSMDVISAPAAGIQNHFVVDIQFNSRVVTLVKNTHFTVYKWEVNGELYSENSHPFLLVSVINGEGIIHANGVQYPIQKGVHFILPADFGNFTVTGQVEAIVSHI